MTHKSLLTVDARTKRRNAAETAVQGLRAGGHRRGDAGPCGHIAHVRDRHRRLVVQTDLRHESPCQLPAEKLDKSGVRDLGGDEKGHHHRL